MDARTVCRICKTEGVRLHCITNTHLQEMHERETRTLLTTEDKKPLLACIECCDRLQHCYQLSNGIEQTENTHTMMNLDPQLQICQNDIHQNNTCVIQSDVEKCVKMEPEQLSDVEVKQESTTDIENGTSQDNEKRLKEHNRITDTDHCSAPTIIKVESVNENQNKANVTTTIKSESCDEQGVECGDVIQWSDSGDDTLHNHAPSQDIPLKTVQILLQRCDDIIATANGILLHNAIQLTENQQPSASDHSSVHTMNMNQNKPKEITTTVKIKSCDEQGAVSNDVIQCSNTEDDTLHNHAPLQDIPLKGVQIMLQRCDDIIDKKMKVSRHRKSEDLEDNSRKQKKITRNNTEETSCGKVTFSDSTLNQLTLRHDVPELKLCRKSNSILGKSSKFECDVCKITFSFKSHLTKHLSIHTGEKPFECNVCNNRFRLKRYLTQHTRVHTGKKPHECDVCKRRFSYRVGLVTHARTHSGNKPFKCDVCAKCFSRNDYLKFHIRIHTGEKPFECDVCKKRFRQKSCLTEHARIHKAEKAFKCDVCQKRFRMRSHLTQHARVHTGERPFECDVCQKRFIQSSSLSTHLLIHTGDKYFECDVCKRRFIQKSDLAKHTRIHTGEKRFKCNYCKKRFIQKGALTSHTRLHTGEKHFKCDVCKKCYSHRSSLTLHNRTKHQ